jgi:hypothetical protein
MATNAYNDGYLACERAGTHGGKASGVCPHPAGSPERKAWMMGAHECLMDSLDVLMALVRELPR